MENIKHFFGYWLGDIILESIKNAIPISEFGGRIMDIFASLIVALLSILVYGNVNPMQGIGLNVGTLLAWLGLTVVFRFVASFIYLPAKMHRDLSIKNKALRESLEPFLEIVYGTDSVYQEKMGITSRAGSLLDGYQIYFRVGVTNQSAGKSAVSVRVQLEGLEPNPIQHIPLPLNPMHGRDVNLNPKETWYWDVVSIFYDTTSVLHKDNFAIRHSVQGISDLLTAQDYRLKIIARADNAPEDIKYFTIEKDSNDRYGLVLTQNPP